MERPNVILICVEQWRGDALSIAGHPVVHTPFLDQLALEGVHFSGAYSGTPSCIAARASLFTGMRQENHGRVGYRDKVEWNYPVTLAGEFTRQGYQTQAIGKMHVYPERSQIGFQNVILHDGFLHSARKPRAAYKLVDDYIPWLRSQLGRDADYFDHGVNCNSYVARPWDKPEFVHPTNYVVTQALDFFRRRDTRKPFFLFLSFARPHPPYDPPEWAFQQYLHQDMPDVPVGDWVELIAPYDDSFRPDCFRGSIEPGILKRARSGYYGHMTHIDHQINRLLEHLPEYGVSEDTWICFLSDHGEMMGDHNLFRKSFPYQGAVRIPLIIKGPPGVIRRKGTTIEQVAEIRDIMPTLLDCAGLGIPESVDGMSLLPLLQGEKIPWERYIHGEHPVFDTSSHWLTDGKQKYIWWSGCGGEQLFDLEKDPQEIHDLSLRSGDRGDENSKSRLDHWRGKMVRELANREEGFSDGERLIPGRPVKSCLSSLDGFR